MNDVEYRIIGKNAQVVAVFDTFEGAAARVVAGDSITCNCPDISKEFWRISCDENVWICDPDTMLDEEVALMVFYAPDLEERTKKYIRDLACTICWRDRHIDEASLEEKARRIIEHYQDRVQVSCSGWSFTVDPDEWDAVRNDWRY